MSLTAPSRFLYAAAIGGAALCQQPAEAATATGTLRVTAEVQGTCTVGPVGEMTFGSYDPTNGNTTSATFSINCTTPMDVAVKMGGGANFNAAGGGRNMSSGENKLTYFLTKDSAGVVPWHPDNSSDEIVNITNPQTPANLQIFGNIPPSQSSPSGVYTDSVTITINF